VGPGNANDDNTWRITVANTTSGENQRWSTGRYVFNGAGGAALLLLQEIRHSRAKAVRWLPGRRVLSCIPPTLKWSARHTAKVYGLAAEGAPPMSRSATLTCVYLDGKRTLFFGRLRTLLYQGF